MNAPAACTRSEGTVGWDGGRERGSECSETFSVLRGRLFRFNMTLETRASQALWRFARRVASAGDCARIFSEGSGMHVIGYCSEVVVDADGRTLCNLNELMNFS